MTDTTDDKKQAMAALKLHGDKILTAIVLVLALFFGYQYYQNHYAKIDTVAADAFTVIEATDQQIAQAQFDAQLDDAGKKQLEAQKAQMFSQIDTLADEHKDTAYAWQALMIKARHQTADNDLKAAIDTLQKAAQVTVDEGFSALTKLRLARVLLADGQLDLALATANEELPKAFESSRQELLGDVYLAQNNTEAAKKAYQTAWEGLRERHETRSVLALKLQSLGVQPEPIEPRAQVVSEEALKQIQAGAQNEAQANPQDAQAADNAQ